jgi:hypothetical protein
VEIGQRYYGAAYTPTLRAVVEQALRDADDYFRKQRMGAQVTYIPHLADAVAQRTALAAKLKTLQPGAIVLVQATNGQGEPHLAILIAPVGSTVELIAEGWKGASHPLNVVQIVPEIDRPDLLSDDPSEVKTRLRQWRDQLALEAVDPIALWDAGPDRPHTFAELAATCATAETRLALGLALLTHGHVLWQRDRGVWTPRARATVLAKHAGFVQHLRLVHAAGHQVQDRAGNLGILTGQSRWGAVEVTWESGITDWRSSGRLTLVHPPQDPSSLGAPHAQHA